MKLEDLTIQIKNKKSFLCVGLDTDIDKIPKFLLNEDDPIFSFNKSIIDNTNEISKKCNVSLETKGYFLPEYPVPKNIILIHF